MIKKFLLALGVALGSWVFLAFGQPMGFARAVEMPTELTAVIAGGIFFLISLVLEGKLPAEYIEEISGAITTAVVTILAVLLRMVPPEFEALATGLLNVLVIILGMVSVVKMLFAGGKRLLKK